MNTSRDLFDTIVFLSFLLCGLGQPLLAQQSLHVYAKEIPWQGMAVVQDSSKIYSIETALSLAQAGDSILIHEGIYREKLTAFKNGLVISNYGNDYVLISGAEVVENWTPTTGMPNGVMQANVSGLGIEMPYSQLFSDGNEEMMGRHPNNTSGKMMHPLESNSGYSLLTSVEKDAGTNANGYATFEETFPNVDLSGGLFRGLTGKMRNYVFGNITAHTSDKVTFKAINSGQWKNQPAISTTKHQASWGFVVHKNLVDIPGEWFLDNNTLYYYPPLSKNINDIRVEIQVRNQVLSIKDVQNLKFHGINFAAGNGEILNSNTISFDACSWRYLQPFWTPGNYGDNQSEKTGIYVNNTSNTHFKNCYLGHSWGNAFALLSGDNHYFENCIIEDIARIGIFASAIYSRTGPITVKNCTFGDAGRFHLRLRSSDKIEVYDSDFYGAMMMGEDAGPIEATSTGSLTALDLKESVFAYNKVHDCVGIPVFDGGYQKQFIVAFYMEDTENYTAHHNLVYNFRANNYTGPLNMDEAGAFLYLGPRYNYMNRPVNYYNNTVWNYDKCINIWHIEADNWQDLGMAESGGSMADGHFENNIFQKNTPFKLNWTKQILNSTGGRVDWVSVSNPPKIETTDFNAFTAHCQNQGYNFNAMNTIILDKMDEGQNFVDATNGDFNLKSGSTAKGAGKTIAGITSMTNPDCGALEGGSRVLSAGATLSIPVFTEVSNLATNLGKAMALAGLKVYPNPASDRLFVEFGDPARLETSVRLYSIEGRLMKVVKAKKGLRKVVMDISELENGLYVIKSSGSEEIVKFIKH